MTIDQLPDSIEYTFDDKDIILQILLDRITALERRVQCIDGAGAEQMESGGIIVRGHASQY